MCSCSSFLPVVSCKFSPRPTYKGKGLVPAGLCRLLLHAPSCKGDVLVAMKATHCLQGRTVPAGLSPPQTVPHTRCPCIAPRGHNFLVCPFFLMFLALARAVSVSGRWSKMLTACWCSFTFIHSYRLLLTSLAWCANNIVFHFQVVTTGNPVLDYETMPKCFDLQIFVEDTAGRTDLKTLTVQVADKNERPVFWGNMATQSKIMAAPEKSSTQKDDIRCRI